MGDELLADMEYVVGGERVILHEDGIREVLTIWGVTEVLDEDTLDMWVLWSVIHVG